jgi:hypothetical protein
MERSMATKARLSSQLKLSSWISRAMAPVRKNKLVRNFIVVDGIVE